MNAPTLEVYPTEPPAGSAQSLLHDRLVAIVASRDGRVLLSLAITPETAKRVGEHLLVLAEQTGGDDEQPVGVGA